MNWLKIVNVIFLQWICVRLTKCKETRTVPIRIIEVSIMSDYSISPCWETELKTFEWYSIQYFIIPLTGWWGSFIYLSKKPLFKQITKQLKTS